MEVALAVARFAHFLAAMFVFGASAFLWAFASEPLARALGAALRPLSIVAAWILPLGALAWLVLESASFAQSWSAALDLDRIGDVLFETAFGHVWQARLLLCAALSIALLFGPRGRSGIVTSLAAATLVSLAGVDHAAMQAGALGWLHRANDATHLLCAALWLGGLPAFWLCLRGANAASIGADAVAAMRRYSDAGHVFVPLIVLTGALNIALTTGALPLPIDSPYRALLAAKIAIVATMTAIAALNRYRLVPRLRQREDALHALRTMSLVEVALAAAAVALVSLFGLWDPA